MAARSRFDDDLEQLHIHLLEMGAMCERAIDEVSEALIHNHMGLAQKVIENGHDIDDEERDIERHCLQLLLRQQPVARDLRQISAALKIITDMERIGDQAEDIAEIIVENRGLNCEPFPQLEKMARDTKKMVKESIDAYVKKDLDLAGNVLQYDDIVDGEFASLKKELMEHISSMQEHIDSEFQESVLDLLMIGKYFERIGDHATNIAEWVTFSITGSHEYGKA